MSHAHTLQNKMGLQNTSSDVSLKHVCPCDGELFQNMNTRVPSKPRYCWDLRLKKLSKSLSKIMIAAEGVESKHSTSWKHQEWMISSSILGDPII